MVDVEEELEVLDVVVVEELDDEEDDDDWLLDEDEVGGVVEADEALDCEAPLRLDPR